MTPEDQTARNRWMLIQLVRLSGVAMLVLGILILTQRIAWPEAAGIVITGVGLAEIIIMPKVLAGLWKSPPE